MEDRSRPIHRLVDASRGRDATDPRLCRIVLRAAHAALRRTFPDDYPRRCHVAAAAIATMLHRLAIRSAVVDGAASWRFGGRKADGTPIEARGGYLIGEDGQAPHHWVETEFDELVDLSCSYFHRALGGQLAGFREHDIIPPTWAPREVLARLPAVRYEARVRYWGGVELAGGDEATRGAIAAAEGSLAAMAVGIADEPLEWGPILADAPSLDALLAGNAWVRRNSRP